jgi:DNA phosphorothioation-dependent restriction protein DptG
MKRISYLIAILMLLSIVESCKKIDSELTPLYQAIDCINKFFQEENRLPENNDELQDYALKNNIPLDLSVFKKFTYQMISDSTYTFDFEISSKAKGGGTMTINIPKSVKDK